MSAINVVPAGPARTRDGRSRLRAVPDAPLADVHQISSAPSARRRREALLQEDPSMRRRPAVAARRRSLGADAHDAVGGVYLRLARRVGLTVVSALLLAGMGAGAGLLAQPDAYAGPTRVHLVSAGESLWGLAEAVDSSRPLEQVVLDIRTLNGLQAGGAGLQPGGEVILPVE
ncbi:MAG: LysM peptidoglycan-binding domain-containing protein [Propionibacterium sp.]|nr:LysM peptidoglycan-binding domain-containing protein [Propionibacterium sp.]MDN6793682.1 LysM peptidoglycan-binding domain-containing protein [Propionibacterium sp.]